MLTTMLLYVAITPARAQPQTWGHVQPMIRQLDQQLENFAATHYDSQAQVLIARASIRARVLARDLLASGVSDPSDVGMTMIFFGTMIYENLGALDNLFGHLPDMDAMEKDMVIPTENQRRTYALLKPVLERFSQNPIGKLKLNVLYPGQVRVRVSHAFSSLADALDAARVPLIHNPWAEPLQSVLRDEQLDQLLKRLDALKVDKDKLPIDQVINAIRPALQLQEFRPVTVKTFIMMSKSVRILEILQKQSSAFLLARPLILKQLQQGTTDFLDVAERLKGIGQLEHVLIFEDVINGLDQLQNQLRDTVVYEQLLAKALDQNDYGRLETAHQWLWPIVNCWYHIRQLNRPTDTAYQSLYDMANGRWSNIKNELAKLTEQMCQDLPMALTAQHNQWLDECHNTRNLFDVLHRIPMLIQHQAQGRFAPLAITAQNMLTQTDDRAGSVIQNANARLITLAVQWQQAIDLLGFHPVNIADEHREGINKRINTDINQWIKLWQNLGENPIPTVNKLKSATDLMHTVEALDQAKTAADDGVFERMGIIDLDKATADELFGQAPNQIRELTRVFVQSNNPQDLKLNQQRTEDDLSFLLALGRLTMYYKDRMPVRLGSRASQVLSRLIWQPSHDQYDADLTQLCIELSLTAREWCYQRKQHDPKHRRELLLSLRQIGNKIIKRLDELQ